MIREGNYDVLKGKLYVSRKLIFQNSLFLVIFSKSVITVVVVIKFIISSG